MNKWDIANFKTPEDPMSKRGKKTNPIIVNENEQVGHVDICSPKFSSNKTSVCVKKEKKK